MHIHFNQPTTLSHRHDFRLRDTRMSRTQYSNLFRNQVVVFIMQLSYTLR